MKKILFYKVTIHNISCQTRNSIQLTCRKAFVDIIDSEVKETNKS